MWRFLSTTFPLFFLSPVCRDERVKMADDTQDINIVFTSRADAPYNIDRPVEKERERKRIKREGKHSVVCTLFYDKEDMHAFQTQQLLAAT